MQINVYFTISVQLRQDHYSNSLNALAAQLLEIYGQNRYQNTQNNKKITGIRDSTKAVNSLQGKVSLNIS